MNFPKVLTGLFVASLTLATSLSGRAADKQTFEQYVAGLKQQAIEKGYQQELVDTAFSNLTYLKKVVKADKGQPEFVETLDTYLPKRVPEWKVKKARAIYKENQELLEKIGKKYGVQPRFIVALWGLESAFGKYQGKMPIIKSLVTLGYEGRRRPFFEGQLWASLEILKQKHIPLDKFLGSWAGAMGQCQFMPTSFLAYAQDGDGDGKKDIWTNKADVFSSVANYLKQEGWSDQKTWGRQVKLPDDFDRTTIMPKGQGRTKWFKNWKATGRTLAEWNELGVRRMDGTELPNRPDLKGVLIMPDDAKGRMYLAYDNYKSLMHWNFSYYFVTSVGYLSDRIGYPKIK